MLATVMIGLLGGMAAAICPAPIASDGGNAPAAMIAKAQDRDPGSSFALESPSRPAANAMVIIGPGTTPDGDQLQRAPDGLFYVNAIVNGAPIRFLVDTGASLVVLTADDARRAGVHPQEDRFDASADTANGRAAMARVTLDEVAVGTTRSRAIAAAVVREGLSVSLLGQNWLSQLASVTIQGDRMLLR